MSRHIRTREIDVQLVYEVDDNGDLVGACYAWDSLSQHLSADCIADPDGHADHLVDIGDLDDELEPDSDEYAAAVAMLDAQKSGESQP